MCGRYATTRSSTDLSALFEAYDETGDRLGARYNVAPTDPVAIVRGAERLAGRALSVARWGLVPAWAKDPRRGARMINARAETVATTSAYSRPFARNRCLVPADGWYEWVRRPDGGKQPYYLAPTDGAVLAFAGIWSVWHGAGEPLLTCAVVTMPALGNLALVHDRMPLLLPRQRWVDWLAGGGDPDRLLAPPAADFLAGIEIRPVGWAVGDVRRDGPELVDRVPAEPLGARPEVSTASMLF